MEQFHMAYLAPTTRSLIVLLDVEDGSPHSSSLVKEAPLEFNGVSFD
jgi:hypothetical protein